MQTLYSSTLFIHNPYSAPQFSLLSRMTILVVVKHCTIQYYLYTIRTLHLVFLVKLYDNSCGCQTLYNSTLFVLSNFINLTQVHNFTDSAQDIFTFRRLSVFTVSLREFCKC